jgi:hypothetical protein
MERAFDLLDLRGMEGIESAANKISAEPRDPSLCGLWTLRETDLALERVRICSIIPLNGPTGALELDVADRLTKLDGLLRSYGAENPFDRFCERNMTFRLVSGCAYLINLRFGLTGAVTSLHTISDPFTIIRLNFMSIDSRTIINIRTMQQFVWLLPVESAMRNSYPNSRPSNRDASQNKKAFIRFNSLFHRQNSILRPGKSRQQGIERGLQSGKVGPGPDLNKQRVDKVPQKGGRSTTVWMRSCRVPPDGLEFQTRVYISIKWPELPDELSCVNDLQSSLQKKSQKQRKH